MIIIFAAVISIFIALIHFVVYKAVISIFSVAIFWKFFIGIAFAALGLSFVAASILTFYFDNFFTRFLYTVSAVWLGIIVYLFLASCLYALAAFVVHAFSRDFDMGWFGCACLVLALVVSVYGLVHARSIVVKDLPIKLDNLPSFWQGRKIVFVSDVHLGQVHLKSWATAVVAKINEQKPDIVFIGGDLYDGVKVDENDIISPFADIHSNFGTYFVTGNHEEFRDVGPYLQAIKSIGIKVLDNETSVVNGLQIVGVDDHDSSDPVKFKSILSGLNIDPAKPSILLKHQPSLLGIAEEAGISLQISGHTHRAQMFPLNIFTYMQFHGYDYGLKSFDKMQVYTSSGVGTWGPPLRVGSDSEIVVFELK